MPRWIRIGTLFGLFGLMLIGCTDPASLSNEIQSLDDTGNTNMPAVQDRGQRLVGNVVMSGVTLSPPTPSPAPTVRPTEAPAPTPSPTGPIVLR